MKFNIFLTGVGGEGVLLTSVVVVRAANIEGHDIRGTQIHGLAQRKGTIPIHVRFGKNIHSPIITRGEADLIIALEPLEAVRYCYFASKKKTNFIIDNYPLMPLLAKTEGKKYPSMESIKKMIEPFAKRIIVTDASNICAKKFGSPIYGNVMTLGLAISAGMMPLKKESVIEAIKQTVPRGLDKNMKAFEMGLNFSEK